MNIKTFLKYNLTIDDRRDAIISELEKLDTETKYLNNQIMTSFINYLNTFISYLLYHSKYSVEEIANSIYNDIIKFK